MRVLMKGALNTVTGYGGDCVGIIRALVRLGHDVYLQPVNCTPPLPDEVVSLLTKHYAPPFDLVIQPLDPPALVAEPGMRRASRKIAAWTMWEWEAYRPENAEVNPLDERMKQFDVLVAYDEVTYKSLHEAAPDVPMLTLQGGYWAEDYPYLADRDWDDTFRFLMVGQLHDRKNPFAAIRAFQNLKEKHGDEFDAELHLKTNVPGLHPAMERMNPGLHIHYIHFSHSQMLKMYENSHCLLAPSRGEGKNMPALEMMSTGGAVIATEYGGHTQWLSSEYAYPLRYELYDYPSGAAAMPDVEHLEELMWHVYTNRSEAAEKGRQAAKTIPAMCDWVNVTRRFLEMVAEIPERSTQEKRAEVLL